MPVFLEISRDSTRKLKTLKNGPGWSDTNLNLCLQIYSERNKNLTLLSRGVGEGAEFEFQTICPWKCWGVEWGEVGQVGAVLKAWIQECVTWNSQADSFPLEEAVTTVLRDGSDCVSFASYLVSSVESPQEAQAAGYSWRDRGLLWDMNWQ